MSKRSNIWDFLGAVVLGNAISTIGTPAEKKPHQRTSPGQQSEGPTPAQRWSLDYKLKSTNYVESPVVIFKFGESAWRQEHYEQLIEDRVRQILALQRSYPVVLTTGSGQVQALSKDMYTRLGITKEAYRRNAGRAIATQAQSLADLFGDKGVYVEPDGLHYITAGMLRDKGVVVSAVGSEYLDFLEIAEEGKRRHINSIPPDQSDAHTMVFAHYVGQKGVVFGNMAPGVFIVDPNVTREHGEVYDFLQQELKIRSYDTNKHLPKIKATEILENRIIRFGSDGKDEHLAEDLGLRLYLNPNSTVQWLQVIDISNRQHVQHAFEGYAKGKIGVGSTITKA